MADRRKPETVASARVVKALKSAGFAPMRVVTGKLSVRRGFVHGAETGTPDYLVLLTRGRIVWWESKFDKGKPNAAQLKKHAELRAKGHTVLVGSDPVEIVRAAISAEGRA